MVYAKCIRAQLFIIIIFINLINFILNFELQLLVKSYKQIEQR